MQFVQVIGQVRAKRQFGMLHAQGRLPHALLISGHPGSGVLPLAWAAAQMLMCTAPANGDSCGQCANCYKVSTVQHADVQWSFPVVTKRSGEKPISEDFYAQFRNAITTNSYISPVQWVSSIDTSNKQGNITARECRELVRKLSQSAMEGNLKVLVMWQPEALGKEGNILLKMIEEPPLDTIIILATENVEQILPTIQSRTQLIQLQPLDLPQIMQGLQMAHNLSEAKALNYARLADGSYTQALQLVDVEATQQTNSTFFAQLRSLLNAVFTANGAAVVGFADEFAGQTRVQQKQVLAYFTLIFEHYVRVANGLGDKVFLQPEEDQVLQKLLAMKLPLPQVDIFCKHISACMVGVERNINAKILATEMLIAMVHGKAKGV